MAEYKERKNKRGIKDSKYNINSIFYMYYIIADI